MRANQTGENNTVLSQIKKNWMFYLAAAAVVFGIKYFFGHADSDSLTWILAPTAWWVRSLCGLPFEYVSHVGYVSHACRFIIASSCSGVQFMMIATVMMICSYVHRMPAKKQGLAWTALCFGTAYLSTVFVNGLRIVLSIYLPPVLPVLLHRPDLYRGWLTHERLHTVTGVTVYVTSLFVLYRVAGKAAGVMGYPQDVKLMQGGRHMQNAGTGQKTKGESDMTRICFRYLPPLLWYIAIVIGIPFLNRAYQNDGRQFVEFTLLIAAVCLVIISLLFMWDMVKKFYREHIKRD